MNTALSGSNLLDPETIADPYSWYRLLQDQAPVWQVPGTQIFVVSSFALVAEATARVDDFSSNMQALLYRGEDGRPERLSFGDVGVQTLATADPPDHTLHRTTVFPRFQIFANEPQHHRVNRNKTDLVAGERRRVR